MNWIYQKDTYLTAFLCLCRNGLIKANLLKGFLSIILQFLITSNVFAQNPIVRENALSGNPASEWDITGAGDLTIQGFATTISVNKGGNIKFKINVQGSNKNFSIRIYRIGYYQGNGARLIANLGSFTGVLQPAPLTNIATGLVDCGNWSQSASWTVPSTAVSGVYIARLMRSDNGGASHIIFIVRDDASTADLLFKTSDATWQAYNVYGGNSLYTGTTPGYAAGHAVKVSYNRPFITRNGGGGGGASEDWIFNAEYPMIRWLERNGYHLSYTTDLDMDRDATAITPAKYKAILSVGHDEYWSQRERNKFEAARNAGVHLAFFSGNEVYWKTRWESSIDGSKTARRTLVCYKEGTLGEYVCNGECDPTTIWTGLWRDGCGATGAADGCKPENGLTGQISWAEATTSIVVPSEYKNYRFWRNTSVASLGAGQSVTLPIGTLGYEWDFEQSQYSSSNPAGRITLSSTTAVGKTHKLSLYRHSSGALVFGAGTVQWSWGLDNVHDRGSLAASPDMQQATVNLFADMGVQPATLQAGLIATSASTDNLAPAAIITTPASGITVQANSNLIISGTATDAGGGIVAGVEISTDGGATWQVVTGTNAWSFAWRPTTEGTFIIQVRGFDDNGNIESGSSSSNTITVIVSGFACPCNIFNDADKNFAITNSIPYNDGIGGIVLGVKFRTSENGFITGLRFYKSSSNTGNHVGQLWSSTGTLLGQATFINETASGWQQVNFSTAVPVSSGTTYIASYFSDLGNYSSNDNYFENSGIYGPVIKLADGDDGPNGLYLYSNSAQFPTQSYNKSNYWVDIVFNRSAALPVSLTYFNLKTDQKNVELNWGTSSESNNSGFSIQRSTDALNWNEIGKVSGAGNSQTSKKYTFTDYDLQKGDYYFRLKQVDFDGKFTYSKILIANIDNGKSYFLGQNYPNPAKHHTTISFGVQTKTHINLALYDLRGRKIKIIVNEVKEPGIYTMDIDLKNIESGLYFYKLLSEEFIMTKRLIVN